MYDSTITWYSLYNSVEPVYMTFRDVLLRIGTGASENAIMQLRGLENGKSAIKASTYKLQNLPCILFSGKFERRQDSGILEHSGLICLDFDKVHVEQTKHALSKFSFIACVFTSPSGNGVKAIACIPKDIAAHRAQFKGLQKELNSIPGLDPSGINISRACFESYDPNYYINLNCTTFDSPIYDKPAKPVVNTTKPLPVNYKLLDTAVNIVLNAPDGQKHAELLKAARLCGGYITSGEILEHQAIEALETAIQSRPIDDFRSAQKTILDGIENGKLYPLQSDTELNDLSFLSSYEDEKDYMGQVRSQTLPQGLGTGFSEFDRYFRFKKGNLVIINGHDNVGKSSFLWFMSVLSNVLHGWKWIFYCAENTEAQVRKTLMQFKTGKALHQMNPTEYDKTLEWAYDNFSIIKSDKIVTAHEVLMLAQRANTFKSHNAFLIDPYNALDLDLENTKLNSHEYHYRVTSELRAFCKRYDMAVYVNCHAVTEALRRTHKDGPYTNYPMAPNKADTEGGGKFANRADDFITIHRYTQHPTDFNLTEIHVRKIKETETGGRPTLKDDPVKFRMEKGLFGFFEPTNGYNPLTDKRAKTEQNELKIKKIAFKEPEKENEDWLNDVPF